MLQQCRNYSCRWLSPEKEDFCPNCGFGTPNRQLFATRKKELDRLSRIVARADEGLPPLAESGGCIFAPIGIAIAILLFASEWTEREPGCGGALGYIFFTLLFSAVLALMVFYGISELLKNSRSKAAAQVVGRWRELERLLSENEDRSLVATEKGNVRAVQLSDEHIADIHRSLQELRKIERSGEVSATKAALVKGISPWLVKKQEALVRLRHIEALRWRNSLANLHPLRLDIRAAPLKDLQELTGTIEGRIENGTRLVQRINDELWPCFSGPLTEAVSSLVSDCRVVEQLLRKRTVQLTLERESLAPGLLPLPASQDRLFSTRLPEPSALRLETPDSVKASLKAAMAEGLPKVELRAEAPLRAKVKAWEKDLEKLLQAM